MAEQDVEQVADDLGVKLGNAADVVYRMRSPYRYLYGAIPVGAGADAAASRKQTRKR